MLGKVVLVTGSSAGIGEACVLSFAKLGCKVVVHGTDKARVEQVAQKCLAVSPSGEKPLEIAGDLRDEKHVEELLDKTVKHFNQLDVLVNNAGIFQPMTIDQPDVYRSYKDLMSVNIDSVVLLTSLAVPHLKKTKGCIVNISSNLHMKTIGGGFAYCTSKAAQNMFTKSIACDLAPDVRVNSVSPGPTATLLSNRLGMDQDTYRQVVGKACLVNRVGEPEEIARAVVFLASPESSFITGTDFIIDGGSTIKTEAQVGGHK